MRPLIIILVVTLLGLQYKLWLGDGSVSQWLALQNHVEATQLENDKLASRNRAIEADIVELKSGDQALEGQARAELGMVKDGEVYYQFME